MKEIATAASAESCTGNCQGCGKTHVKVFGQHDTQSEQLVERVHEALRQAAVDGKVLEITDPETVKAHGVGALPALMVEGEVVVRGMVPSVDLLVRLFQNKDLFRSRLYRLNTVSVPVDMSEVSANALVFAWKITQKTGSRLEVVYAMDSIFEGSQPSATGFLSGYANTMQTELDDFVVETLGAIGVRYEAPAKFGGKPGAYTETRPSIASKVIFGAPDLALVEHSRQADLLVMGATGRGNLGKKLFGSVSAEVSKNAHCPVLFVPKEADFRGFEQVLYASDFDSLHPLAVQQAVSFAQRFDGQVHFVHVGSGGKADLEVQRGKFEKIFGQTGTAKPFIFTKMVSDDIIGALYEYSFYHRIQLLVFVTHHRNIWDNLLHKSVTQEVLMSSNLPVLVIHSDGDMV